MVEPVAGSLFALHIRACQGELGDDLGKVLPVIREGGSDTATFDNVLEFLVMAGRPLPLAVLMMIPEAWSGHESMSEERKAFYEYHGCLMEPWDGPASIAFTSICFCSDAIENANPVSLDYRGQLAEALEAEKTRVPTL